MRWFLKRLYRERRRLWLVAFVTFATGAIIFSVFPATVFGLPFFLVAGLAFLFGLTPFLMLIVVLFPSVRHSAETAVLWVPLGAVGGVLVNNSDTFGGLPMWINIPILVICYVGVLTYTGPVINRLFPARKMTSVSHSISTLTPEKLWPYFTPTPDIASEYWDENVISIEWMNAADTYLITHRMNDIAKVEEVYALEHVDFPGEFRFRFDVPSAAKTAIGASGTNTVRLIKDGQKTRVQMTRTSDRMTWGRKLFFWIDDHFGRLDDETIRRAETSDAAKTQPA